MKIREFANRHKNGIVAVACGLVSGAIVSMAFLSAVLFGYYKVSPQDTVGITIKEADIQGSKEDGSAINGFVIEKDDGTEYLVTDYWAPIVLSDDLPSEE